MISTYHSTNIIGTDKKHYLTKEKIIRPQCVIDYNITMGAVGKVDQILYSLNSTRKCLKWYSNFFFHLLDLAVYNTFTLYKHQTGRNLSLAKFHSHLIKQILRQYLVDRTPKCKSIDGNPKDLPFRVIQ